MNKKLKSVITMALTMSVILSPFAFKVTHASELETPINGSLTFVGGDINDETYMSVKELLNKDESLNKFEQIFNNDNSRSITEDGKIKFMDSVKSKTSNVFTNQDEIAVNINSVKEDKTTQDYLKELVKQGVKVYLYGENITVQDYKNLLGIDEIYVDKANENGGKFKLEFGFDEKEVLKSKKENAPIMDKKELALTKSLKEGTTEGEKETEKENYNVIGYDIDGSNNKLVLSTIKVSNLSSDNRIVLGQGTISKENYFTNILDSFYETKKLDSESNMNSRSITYVCEASAYIKGEVYSSSNTLMGKSITDWYMKRETAETSKTYDYFALEERSSFTGYNFYGVRNFYTDHDIPYISAGDRITDWKPDKSETDTHNVSLSLGAGSANLSYSFSTGSKFSIEDLGSRELSYGRWKGTNYSILPPTSVAKWYPSTSWLSTGKTAIIDIRTKAGYCYKSPLSAVSETSIYTRCAATSYGSNNS